jgi:DNA repair protein RadC
MTHEQTIKRALKILDARMRHEPVLSAPTAVRDYLRLSLHDRGHEVFVCIFLDSQHRVISCEVVKAALAHNAAAVIFSHNHPSGIAEPSRADELLTQSLKQALALMDIRTLDHFVVAGNELVSFAERGLL